ncbi:hypothetical protein NKG05_00565 [Oerskovia sp. M15]
MTSSDVSQALLEVDPLRELEIADAVQAIDVALAPQDCKTLVRAFEPAALPAMLLHDRDGDHERQAQATAGAVDDLWGQVLAELSGRPVASARAQRRQRDRPLLLATTDPQVRAAGASPCTSPPCSCQDGPCARPRRPS